MWLRPKIKTLRHRLGGRAKIRAPGGRPATPRASKLGRPCAPIKKI